MVNPDLVEIWDEPTALLDPISESEINKNFNKETYFPEQKMRLLLYEGLLTNIGNSFAAKHI